VSISLNSVLAGTSDQMNCYIWKNGVTIFGAYMVYKPSYPQGTSACTIITSNAGDYFELTAEVTSLTGGINVVAYSLELLQLS
jgi:hypothetical protein